MTDNRLITLDAGAGPRAGIAVGGSFTDAAAATGQQADASVLAILDGWESASPRLARAAETAGNWRPLDGVTLLPPVHHPVTICCAGASYSDHVARMAQMLGLPPDPDPHEIGLNLWHFMSRDT